MGRWACLLTRRQNKFGIPASFTAHIYSGRTSTDNERLLLIVHANFRIGHAAEGLVFPLIHSLMDPFADGRGYVVLARYNEAIWRINVMIAWYPGDVPSSLGVCCVHT